MIEQKKKDKTKKETSHTQEWQNDENMKWESQRKYDVKWVKEKSDDTFHEWYLGNVIFIYLFDNALPLCLTRSPPDSSPLSSTSMSFHRWQLSSLISNWKPQNVLLLYFFLVPSWNHFASIDDRLADKMNHKQTDLMIFYRNHVIDNGEMIRRNINVNRSFHHFLFFFLSIFVVHSTSQNELWTSFFVHNLNLTMFVLFIGRGHKTHVKLKKKEWTYVRRTFIIITDFLSFPFGHNCCSSEEIPLRFFFFFAFFRIYFDCRLQSRNTDVVMPIAVSIPFFLCACVMLMMCVDRTQIVPLYCARAHDGLPNQTDEKKNKSKVQQQRCSLRSADDDEKKSEKDDWKLFDEIQADFFRFRLAREWILRFGSVHSHAIRCRQRFVTFALFHLSAYAIRRPPNCLRKILVRQLWKEPKEIWMFSSVLCCFFHSIQFAFAFCCGWRLNGEVEIKENLKKSINETNAWSYFGILVTQPFKAFSAHMFSSSIAQRCYKHEENTKNRFGRRRCRCQKNENHSDKAKSRACYGTLPYDVIHLVIFVPSSSSFFSIFLLSRFARTTGCVCLPLRCIHMIFSKLYDLPFDRITVLLFSFDNIFLKFFGKENSLGVRHWMVKTHWKSFPHDNRVLTQTVRTPTPMQIGRVAILIFPKQPHVVPLSMCLCVLLFIIVATLVLLSIEAKKCRKPNEFDWIAFAWNVRRARQRPLFLPHILIHTHELALFSWNMMNIYYDKVQDES